MTTRSLPSLFSGVALVAIFIVSVVIPGIVLGALADWPKSIAILVASATCIPAALATFFPIYWVDKAWRGAQEKIDDIGITGHGLLFAQAAIFFFAPILLSSRAEGPAIMHLGFVDWVICLIAAGATAYGGRAQKRRQEQRLALANLAAKRPHTATRFVARVDDRGWPEIQPNNVLQYQAAFENLFNRIDFSKHNGLHELSAMDERILVQTSIDLMYSDIQSNKTLWPFVTLALALTYINTPIAERESERTDWAAAIATHPDASRVRDWVYPIATKLFRAHGDSRVRCE
jgi:hypothetical protein